MKKAWQGVGLLALALCVLVSTGRVSFGRVTTADSTDVWCVGPSGAEICVDTSGNLVPTTDNDTTLGTSSLKWATVNAYDVNIGDDLAVTDAASVSGAATLGGMLTYTKTQIGTGTGNLGVYVSTRIPVTSTYQTVISSGLNVVLTTTPSIATATAAGVQLPSGTILVLSSTSTASSVTLQDEGTLAGSFLQLGAATRTISSFKTLTLIYDATDGYWREISYGNN